MAKQRRQDQEVLHEIGRLTLRGYRPADIHRRLIEKFPPNVVPTPKTVENIVREDFAPGDASERWRLADATGEEAAEILPILGTVIEYTEGRIRHFTVAEAAWVVRLLTSGTVNHPLQVWQLAREYVAREARGLPTGDLDQALAVGVHSPDKSIRELGHEARDRGWIDTRPAADIFPGGVDDD
jgi:hypothetical protein